MKRVKKGSAYELTGIAENLKKGITEMLILSFLNERSMHIYAIVKKIDEYSNGICSITFPYAAIYRLLDNGYITDGEKKVDANRLRQFYQITDSGKSYLESMKKEYYKFIRAVDRIFELQDSEDKESDEK